jgi:hypothetical protein
MKEKAVTHEDSENPGRYFWCRDDVDKGTPIALRMRIKEGRFPNRPPFQTAVCKPPLLGLFATRNGLCRGA